MLLDALRYVETNLSALDSGAALVAGKNQYLVNSELAVSLYIALMQVAAGGGIMRVPVSHILDAVEKYRKAWGSPT